MQQIKSTPPLLIIAPLLIGCFVLLSLGILNLTGITEIISHQCYLYINQNVLEDGSFGKVAGTWDAIKGHDYPRLGIFAWGAGQQVEWWAKFDLIISSNPPAVAIKALNPNAYVFPTNDINAGARVNPYYEAWRVKDSYGNDIRLYGEYGPFFANITDIPESPVVNGKKYWQAAVERMTNIANRPGMDGAATDGMWDCPGTWVSPDLDINLDGTNDFDDPGQNTICNWWHEGNHKFIVDWRANNPGKYFVRNAGSWYEREWNLMEGMFLEHSWGLASWSWFLDHYQRWMQTAPEPHLMFVDGLQTFKRGCCYDTTPVNPENPATDDFQAMRFLLGATLLGDGYFDFHGVWDEGGEHYVVKYYDEFDVELGWPTQPMQRIYPGAYGRGVWVRFFDNGVSIVNATGENVTVSNSDLAGLPGYDGPYYRFQGGQDPIWNNGQLLESLEMEGWFINQTADYLVGDAIILIKEPQSVVADIYVDNNCKSRSGLCTGDDYSGTSPASKAASYEGNRWDVARYNNSWVMYEANWMNMYGFTYNNSPHERENAIYRPTIGVAGKYEVFEWHSSADYKVCSNNQVVKCYDNRACLSPGACDHAIDVSEATNVTHIIENVTPVDTNNLPNNCSNISNEQTSCTVNQQANQGQWNSLGKYNFDAGDSAYVKIQTAGANGTVIADAMKFVFLDNQRNLLPDFNNDGQVNIQDFAILLSNWHKSGIDLMFNNKTLDLVLDNQVNVSDLSVLLSCWGNPSYSSQPACFE
ncbi:hypothetical protein ACFL1Y_01840 [Patescibacteria group bacterium]